MVEGIDDDLLARLALKNPTLLQAELLTSTAAVNTFVGSELSPLLHVDDETLACFASLEPTSVQLQILRTPGSIQAFVNLKMQRGEMPVSSSNPFSLLQERLVPTVPTYVYSFDEAELLHCCECYVNGRKSCGKGSNKRNAKSQAAAAMLHMIE